MYTPYYSKRQTDRKKKRGGACKGNQICTKAAYCYSYPTIVTSFRATHCSHVLCVDGKRGEGTSRTLRMALLKPFGEILSLKTENRQAHFLDLVFRT